MTDTVRISIFCRLHPHFHMLEQQGNVKVYFFYLLLIRIFFLLWSRNFELVYRAEFSIIIRLAGTFQLHVKMQKN